MEFRGSDTRLYPALSRPTSNTQGRSLKLRSHPLSLESSSQPVHDMSFEALYAYMIAIGGPNFAAGSGSMQRLVTYFWCWLMVSTGYVARVVMGSARKNITAGSIHRLYCTCCSRKALIMYAGCVWLTRILRQPSHQTLTYSLSARRSLHNGNGTRECSSPGRSVDTSAPQTLTKDLMRSSHGAD